MFFFNEAAPKETSEKSRPIQRVDYPTADPIKAAFRKIYVFFAILTTKFS